MRIRNILKGIRFKADRAAAGLDVKKVTDDSRAVSSGGLFVAVRGYTQDGYAFIGAAIGNGAGAVIAEKDFDAPAGVAKILVSDTRGAMPVIADNFYGRPSRALKVAGITGTNGKTTITYLIESIVKAAGGEPGVIGTINYRHKGIVIAAGNTTPGPLELQSMLAGMKDGGVSHVVMEVSSHSLDQGRVDRISFDVGIFTNITSDHLDYHKTRAKYFKAKKRLFDHLKDKGVAVLNRDDRKVASLERLLGKKVVTYGVNAGADVSALDVSLSMGGTRFTVKTPKGFFKIRTALIGMHNVSNILAAIAAAISLGIGRDAIIQGVESVSAVPGRLEAVDAGQPFKVFVDFAHTEDALFNILSLLRDVAEQRIVTVFGCGGNRDRTKRPRMGKVACRFSDHVIITSDNPRFEEPRAIVEEIECGVKGEFSNYDIVVDRKEAISKALTLARRNDIIVIAGKGHESYQIVRDAVMPFDDREVALGMLNKIKIQKSKVKTGGSLPRP